MSVRYSGSHVTFYSTIHASPIKLAQLWHDLQPTRIYLTSWDKESSQLSGTLRVCINCSFFYYLMVLTDACFKSCERIYTIDLDILV